MDCYDFESSRVPGNQAWRIWYMEEASIALQLDRCELEADEEADLELQLQASEHGRGACIQAQGKLASHLPLGGKLGKP